MRRVREFLTIVRARSWLLAIFLIALAGPAVLAQGVAAATGTSTEAAAPASAAAELERGITWAFLSASLLEWLKRNQRVQMVSDRLAWGTQRLLGIALAIGTAAGIHVSFEVQTGVLTITGLIWDNVWNAGGESLRQFVLQELTYRGFIKNYGKEQ